MKSAKAAAKAAAKAKKVVAKPLNKQELQKNETELKQDLEAINIELHELHGRIQHLNTKKAVAAGALASIQKLIGDYFPDGKPPAAPKA